MRILVIDDEMNICLTLKNIFEDEGFECEFILDVQDLMNRIENFKPEVILLDVRLDGANGLDILEKIRKLNTNIIVIMISGHSGITEAVKAMKLGAYDFLEKPLSLTKVKIVVKKAYEFMALAQDYQRLKDDVEEQYRIIGRSTTIRDMLKLIEKVAPSDAKVLIRGESGTGKELIAFAIHNRSRRKDRPFVKFNSAAIPNELVESELFGYEKGAFTGAVSNKNGKIEQADSGTLFLDEIGDMSLNAQAKILRVIQEGEFERVGSNKTKKINTRIIAATHKNLEQLVEQGLFREDLYYRLNVIPIISPPLREHPEDIADLVDHYSRIYSRELKTPLKTFPPATITELQSWQFKGNVRELKNLIERIYILSDKIEIKCADIYEIRLSSVQETDFWNQTRSFKEKKKEFETRYLATQLKMFNGNLSKTAENLALQVSNLSRKIKDLGIKF